MLCTCGHHYLNHKNHSGCCTAQLDLSLVLSARTIDQWCPCSSFRKQVQLPSPEQIAKAQQEIKEEDEAARRKIQLAELDRRTSLPSEHPDHLHGLHCDGQDGCNSYCVRLRKKLFGVD